MSKKNLSKLLALYLPYVVIGLLATNLGEAWRLAVGKELGDKIVSLMDTLPAAFSNPLPSLHPFDLFIGLCCGAGMRLAVYLKGKNAKKYRHGMEYGSARWGGPKDIEPFMAPKFEDNIILTKTERLMMSNRPPDPKNARNKNVLVVGGSGSGKTRFWLKPNLLQCHSSYVVTDPKGSIGVECGEALLKHGYKLKFFNTINFSKSMDVLPSDLATYGRDAKALLKELQSQNERMFLVTFLVLNTGKTEQELETNVFQAVSIAQKHNCELCRLDFQQEQGLMSSLPLADCQIEIQRGLTTSSTAIFVPFTTQELFDNGKESLYYGLNALSNNLIMVDRKKLKNPNGLILGTPGSGKSFSAKREICNAFLVTDDDIIICDPEAEYAPLVERLHGQVIHISPASTQYINPMDINSNYSEEDNPLALKADFVLSLCELVVGGKEGLQPVEKTVIDRCVHVIYRKYFENPIPENMPLLEDLYNALLTQDEPEARHVAAALEIYVKGSLNIFNHHTNVDINNRINASRLFSCLYGQPLAVGRVMTPVLAMTVVREAAIAAFVPEKFYTVALTLADGGTASSKRFAQKADAELLLSKCRKEGRVTVQKMERKEKSESPPQLYDLTALQRDANRLLGFTAQQTLDYAQSLYEKRLITYPRTDSRFLTEDMAASLPGLVTNTGRAFAVEEPFPIHVQQVINSSKVTDHHALLPTKSMGNADLAALPAGERNILRLIAARLLCAVGEPYCYAETTIITICAGEEFSAKGKVVLSEGWKAVERKMLGELLGKQKEPAVLLDVQEQSQCSVAGAELKEGQTSPPKPYTEDTLLSAMQAAGADSMPEGVERQGIGTPATRAATIEKLVQKGFLERKGSKKTKVLLPTDKGKALITVMPEEIQSPEMTADWETKLLQIERGEMEPGEFMTEINTMITELVKNTEMKKGVNALILNSTNRKVAGVTEMKNRIIDIIFLTVFVSINLWAILTKNYSNSFLAGIAGMCLVTAILYLRKGKK